MPSPFSVSSDVCDHSTLHAWFTTPQTLLLHQMKTRSQTVHACGDALSGSENGRAGHKDFSARLDCKVGSRRIDASVHLQITRWLDPLDHLAYAPDLWQNRREEMLMAEAWVDRHDQYLIKVGQDLL